MPGRTVAVLRALYGAVLLAAPGPVLAAVAHGEPADGAARAFARALGARQLAEAALLRHARGRRAALGALVDALHALSVLAIAVERPRRRRLAGANAVVAGAFAIEGAVRARSG